MLIWDRARGVCRVVWDRKDSGPVWLEFAFLGGTEQRVPMHRVEGCWVAEIPGQNGWLLLVTLLAGVLFREHWPEP